MRFTLDQLATFDCIARLGSFNAAARHMNLTQPTISQRVRELEMALGHPLFVRRGPRTQLTTEGETLLGPARDMLAMSQTIASRFSSATPLNGSLRFGSTDTFAHVCLAEMIERVEAIYPGISIAACVDNSAMINRLLQEGQIDIAVISQPEFGNDIVTSELGYNAMAWVAGSGLRLPAGPISAGTLAEQHLLLTAPPSRLHATVMNWFAEAGVTPRRISTCNSLFVIADMVDQGLAVGVLPVSAVRRQIAARRVRVLDVSPSLGGHRAALCYRRDNLSPGLQEVAQIVRDLVDKHQLFIP
ncbi:LysR family transcriptional regulator [Bosea caraganae]|uniref:LysR family transcriptional regulator n=1 Tax=Bosea caraganae TaxID=2763117 RepID=A0A370L1D5_9HYPH|nr:LysR family transcriptional regulator [Bosea caraganae]RDJ20652.1 LysR family transcriptional regulator [Bosea caraganae]RDJ28929.1 LysR family transcriptional regulator [Bosea caraganae]